MPGNMPAQTAVRVTRSHGASSETKPSQTFRPRLTRANTAQSKLRDAFTATSSSDNDGHEDPASPLTQYEPPAKQIMQHTLDLSNSPTRNSPTRPRRRTMGSTSKALSPFGESHNRRMPTLRRRTSIDKPRKRRSLEKPQEQPLALEASAPKARPKPRASAPSRIPAPVRFNAPNNAATHTPERPTPDTDSLVKSQEDSLKKLSLFSPTKHTTRSPTFSPPDNSPSTGRQVKMMDAPFHSRTSSDLLEFFFDESPEQPKIQRFPLNFHPESNRSAVFQRQISHAHVLFGGPAILSPPSEEVPPASSQPTQGDDDDDDFFRAPSPSKGPALAEPEIVRKFKPRDSGVVVSDDSEVGSPPARKLPRLLQLVANEKGLQAEKEKTTPTTRAARRAVRWPVDIPLGDEHGNDQQALKILFQTVAGAHENDKASGPRTPVKKSSAARMFSSVPRPRATLGPALATKGRKSMPSSRLDLHSATRALSPELKGPSGAPSGQNLAPRKERPTLLTDFLRRCDQGGLPSASSSDSLSASDNTPTGYKSKVGLPAREQARTHATKRPSHRLHIVQGLISREDEEGRFENQFQVLGELGRGQFGDVLRVKDRLRDFEYAVKKSQRYEGIRHRNRLREEVEVLKGLTERGGHVNVLEYIDSWDEDDHLYIQTALCPMGNLSTFLNEYGKHFDRLEEAYIWKIVAEVGDGLRFIHSNGFIHLDLKPANIFVSNEGRLRIGDFGMASAWPRQVTGDFEREGDREYMAPEILRGVYGKAADIFSLGMAVLEAAANIVPPDMGPPWHKLRQENFDAYFDGLSGALAQLIRDLMRTDPTKRLTIDQVCSNAIVGRARGWMNAKRAKAGKEGRTAILGSALAQEKEGFLKDVLGVDDEMDLSD